MSLSIIWAVGTRSGSEFAVSLTEAAHHPRELRELKISGARERFVKATGRHIPMGLEEVIAACRSTDALKLEEPTVDAWMGVLLGEFPRAKVIGTYRPIDQVIRSHQRLRDSWGFPPDRVLRLFAERLRLYEALASSRPVFVVPIADPTRFNHTAFLRFLGVGPSQRFSDFVSSWPAINDTQHLLTLPQYSGYTAPDDAGTSVVAAAELVERYGRLIEASNAY